MATRVIQWLSGPYEDAHEQSEQAQDAAAIACGALADARRTATHAEANAAATSAEAQVLQAEEASKKADSIMKANPNDTSVAMLAANARVAVEQTKACAKEARSIADSKLGEEHVKEKRSNAWAWIALAAALGLGLAIAS